MASDRTDTLSYTLLFVNSADVGKIRISKMNSDAVIFEDFA